MDDAIPDSLIGILFERGRYEEEVIEQIKVAFDKNDRDAVFDLVGKLLYEGPGASGTAFQVGEITSPRKSKGKADPPKSKERAK